MKTKLLTLFIGLSFCAAVSGQVKIGDNPQNIDGASLLELESGTRALVITRINTSQMNAMAPLQGAVIYNTDTQCLHYYSGTGWINICEALGQQRTFTANAVVNPFPTIVITETTNNLNFEVGLITGDNIQAGSVTQTNLAQNSVGRDQLVDNAITPAEIDLTTVTLSTFTNDAGFITGPVVSTDANNAITPGTDSGAFYDDSTLQNDIATNSTNITANTTGLANHIAADGDLDDQNELQNLEQVLSTGNDANNNVITNLSNPVNPQDAATKVYVDNAIIGATQTVVSADANNAITPGTDGGAFYDDNVIQSDISNNANNIATNATDIATNAANIALKENTINKSDDIALGNSAVLFPTQNAVKTYVDNAISAGGGEINTASNEGAAGTGVFIQKTGVNLEFRNINAGSNLVTVTDDAANNEIDIDVNEANLTITASQISDVNTLDEVADGTTITGTGTALDPFKIEPSLTDNQVLTTVAGAVVWQDLPPVGGTLEFDPATIAGDGSMATPYTLADNAVTTVKIADATILGEDISPMGAIDGQVLKWNNTLGVWEPANDFGNNFFAGAGLTLNGSTFDVNADDVTIEVNGADDLQVKTDGITTTQIANGTIIEEDIADNAITTAKILDATILGEDINQMSATDGQVLKWSDAGSIWAPADEAAVHTGAPNSIFFAADPSGLPITAETTPFPGNAGGLFWNPVSRSNTGALFVGLKPDSPNTLNANTVSTKMVIAERLPFGLAYPLKIVNEGNNAGASAGILFSTEGTGFHGKGALVYERKLSQGRGDFHFLQSTAINTVNPDLGMAAMTIKNDGNVIIAPNTRALTPQPPQKLYVGGTMRLTGNFFDETNLPGTPGQILSATATGTTWIDAPTGTGGTLASADGSVLILQAGADYDFAVTAASTPVAATPANYTIPVGETNVEGHLAGIDAALAASGGNPNDELNTAFLVNAGNLEITDANGTLSVPLNQIDTDDQTATEVTYTNTTSGLTALNVQDAIDEIAATGGSDNQNISGSSLTGTMLTIGIENGTSETVELASLLGTDDQTAAEVTYTNTTSGLTATNVQAAIDEIAATGGSDNQNISGSGLTGTMLTIGIENGTSETVELASLLGTDNQTATEVTYTNTTSGLTATDVQAAIDELAATAGSGLNLSNSDLTQNADLLRTFEIPDATQSLVFSGAGNVGIGNFGGANPALSTDKLDVNGQIRARQGFAANGGTVGQPSFGFHTGGDSDTGLYRPAADEIGFSVGGVEAMRVDEFTTGSTQILVQERLGIGFNLPPDANYSGLDVNSTLQVAGSFATAIFTTSGNLTLNDTHHTIILGGNHNITLPASGSFTGRIYIIKNTTGFTPTITSYIDSFGTPTTTIPAGVIHLQSDGSNWQQIN